MAPGIITSIPAPAGEPVRCAQPGARCRVHPRSGGGGFQGSTLPRKVVRPQGGREIER
jgi:hypothetical protein